MKDEKDEKLKADLIGLRVESGSHGEARGREPLGQVAHRHEVVGEDLGEARPLQGIVLK